MALDYISYSQYNTYTSCPRSWYLSKLRNAEARQTWYIPVGSAVHDMIEDWLQASPDTRVEPKAEDFFYPLVQRQMLIEPDMGKWLAGGPKDAPVIEEKALKLVQDCFEKALEYLDEIDVWEVEYDASGRLPGLSVPIKAYVDIIGEHKKQGPVIWDWKTGSTKPGNFQLETYASLLTQPALSGEDHPFTEHGSLPFKGRYVMLAPGKPVTRHVDLSEVDPAEIGKKYQKVYDRMQEKHYEAKAGFDCGFCFNQDNCLVNAGMTKRAVYYDKSEEDGYPF
jgi:RecB family exonuclease